MEKRTINTAGSMDGNLLTKQKTEESEDSDEDEIFYDNNYPTNAS